MLEENGRGERVFFPSHSNGHQAWNIPMATKHGIFHWPPSQEPSPSPSPSIGNQAKELHPLFKRRTWILGKDFFSPEKTISIQSWECLLRQVSWGGEEGSTLELERGRRIEWGSCKSFQGMEVKSGRLEG